MLNQIVRISPSGPRVTNDTGSHFIPGEGLVMRAEIQSANTEGYSIPTGSSVEIKDDMAAPTEAPFMRPKFENCQLGTKYSARAQATLFTRSTWNGGQVSLTVEGSIDDGASWMTLANTATEVPGDIATEDSSSSVTLGFEMLGILGSDITGLVAGASLTIRALLSHDGVDLAVATTGAPNLSPADAASGNYLVLQEVL